MQQPLESRTLEVPTRSKATARGRNLHSARHVCLRPRRVQWWEHVVSGSHHVDQSSAAHGATGYLAEFRSTRGLIQFELDPGPDFFDDAHDRRQSRPRALDRKRSAVRRVMSMMVGR